MRVPSIGMPLDERLIVREGYRWAERMLAGYQDKPSWSDKMSAWLRQVGRSLAHLVHG